TLAALCPALVGVGEGRAGLAVHGAALLLLVPAGDVHDALAGLDGDALGEGHALLALGPLEVDDSGVNGGLHLVSERDGTLSDAAHDGPLGGWRVSRRCRGSRRQPSGDGPRRPT